jgi:hypothetical protein
VSKVRRNAEANAHLRNEPNWSDQIDRSIMSYAKAQPTSLSDSEWACRVAVATGPAVRQPVGEPSVGVSAAITACTGGQAASGTRRGLRTQAVVYETKPISQKETLRPFGLMSIANLGHRSILTRHCGPAGHGTRRGFRSRRANLRNEPNPLTELLIRQDDQPITHFDHERSPAVSGATGKGREPPMD